MTRSISIARRLTVTVLVLELVAALTLISAITIRERHFQFKAFDIALQGKADSLMGAVQDADDTGDNVLLDLRGMSLGQDALFSVEDNGKILGTNGALPKQIEVSSSGASVYQNIDVKRKNFRFVILHGLRIIDPKDAGGGVHHSITVLYGEPVGKVWHEILESVRFFAIATLVLLGLTTIAMVFLLRRGLLPLRELAAKAERVTHREWRFESPQSAKQTEELRPLAEALEKAVARLQSSFEQQKRFTSDAAHELKTDIAIVKSSIQLLSMRKRTVEEYGQGIAQVLKDFTRLETTVQRMLALARLEQPAEENHHSCLLRDVIEEVLFQNKPFAEMHEVEVSVRIDQDVEVSIDRRDALLLFSNILVNALQHSPGHSTINVKLVFASGWANITFRDQGKGVAAEDLPHLFEPFYRGDPSRSRKSGGSGLGLPIARAICERAQGTIEISNNVEGGAVVALTLPARLVGEPTPSGSIKQESRQ